MKVASAEVMMMAVVMGVAVMVNSADYCDNWTAESGKE